MLFFYYIYFLPAAAKITRRPSPPPPIITFGLGPSSMRKARPSVAKSARRSQRAAAEGPAVVTRAGRSRPCAAAAAVAAVAACGVVVAALPAVVGAAYVRAVDLS